MKNVMPFVPYGSASVLGRTGATRVLVRLHFRTSVDARAYINPSLGGRAIFRRIHELSNVSPLLVNLSQVLGTELLVHLKLLLCPVFLAGVNVSLPQPVMDIRQVRAKLEGTLVLRNRLRIFILVRVEISQLQARLSEFRIERNRLLQQSFDLLRVQSGILGPLSLPQTHRIVIGGSRVLRLKFRKTAETLDDLIRLARRAV